LIVRKASVVSLPPFAGRGIARELGIRRAVRFRMAAAVARGLIRSCLWGAADRQATDDADTGLGGMVIVAPSRTVNRTSRLGFPAVPQAFLRFRVRRHGAHIYIPFIANLKLPFKFDRS